MVATAIVLKVLSLKKKKNKTAELRDGGGLPSRTKIATYKPKSTDCDLTRQLGRFKNFIKNGL